MINLDNVKLEVPETLIDRICSLYREQSSKNVAELFETACEEQKIEITSFYKEDIVTLGLYVCQIILNNEIFLDVSSGTSHNRAYLNTVTKFINLCLKQRDIQFRFLEYGIDSLYEELEESIECIQFRKNIIDKLVHAYQGILKTGHLSKMHLMNYDKIKTKLSESNPEIHFTESYYVISESKVLCSIFVNEVLLIQQYEGQNHKEALENTSKAFFEAYGIVSKENSNNTEIPNGILNKEKILHQLNPLFKEKMKNQKDNINYWTIIQECVKDLRFEMTIKGGEVKINGITIVYITDVNEYVGNIKAGKEIVRLLCEDQHVLEFPLNNRKNILPVLSVPQNNLQSTVMNFPKNTKIYSKEELNDKMKAIVIEAHKKYMDNRNQMFWNLLNQEFLNENFKVDPRYKNTLYEIICTLVFQGFNIISGSGRDKHSARETASRNLIERYMPQNYLPKNL